MPTLTRNASGLHLHKLGDSILAKSLFETQNIFNQKLESFASYSKTVNDLRVSTPECYCTYNYDLGKI